MSLYRLSKEAEQDLEDIWVYLAQRNDIAGDRQVAKLLDRFPMLTQFPTMGVSRDRLLEGLRSFPVKPYIIFYILIPDGPDGIEILRIIHQSRDIEDYFS
jgi:toxin ParE1/3/4